MQFDQITGHNKLKMQLCQLAQDARIPHAQIFLGPEGCGKLALAIAFAQYVLCENKKEAESCGQCSACTKASKFIHPDIHFSFPVVGSKMTSNHFLTEWRQALQENVYMDINKWLQNIGAENKQGNINVDECNSIIKKLSLKTFEAEYKILIIWLPEYLGKEGNRLLKLIEEPPENTLFLLVAEDQERILQTILSRCQLMKINRLSDADITSALQQKYPGTAADRLAAVTHMANGNLNEALKIFQQAENDQAALFLDWLRKCYQGNGANLVKWVEAFAKIGRENQKQFVQYALHFMREFLQLTIAPGSPVRLLNNELTTAKKLTKVITAMHVMEITGLLDDCYYHIERNANPKILFLDASIKINKIIKGRK
ncbi:MAG: DNA polymerase-3 subunit delta' [Nonlabens sp.]|jgi:DNA polymerase-3 subunit delta'